MPEGNEGAGAAGGTGTGTSSEANAGLPLDFLDPALIGPPQTGGSLAAMAASGAAAPPTDRAHEEAPPGHKPGPRSHVHYSFASDGAIKGHPAI